VRDRWQRALYPCRKARLGAYYKNPDTLQFAWKKKGRELAGIRYEPLFPYFASLTEKAPLSP